MVLFFVLEKLVLWRHCHDNECEVHGRAAPLILIGDAFHNFVDGVVIAAAFLTSIPLGIAASLAVIAHEIPQEVGDFAILLDNGYGRTKALILNRLSAVTTLPGAVLAYFWLGEDARGSALHPGDLRRELHLHRRGRPHPGAAPAGDRRRLPAPARAAARGNRHDRVAACQQASSLPPATEASKRSMRPRVRVPQLWRARPGSSTSRRGHMQISSGARLEPGS